MPPRRGPPSRAQLAFDALLAPDDAADADPTPRRRAGPARSRRGDERITRHAFALRDDVEREAAAAADPATVLARRFPGVDPTLLADTLAAVGGALDAAIAALATLGIHEGPPPPVRTPAAPADAWRPTPSVYSGPWGGLPPDVQAVIWTLLPARDAARAAPTCREFAQRAAAGRAAVRALKVPRGAAAGVVQAMVAAHPRATSLDFGKWGRLDGDDAAAQLDALLAAAETGEARRERRLTAVTLPPGDGLQDGDLAAAIFRLTGLHRFTIAGCDAAGDGVARAAARYRRTAPGWESADSDGSSPPDAPPPPPSTTAAGLVAAGLDRAAARGTAPAARRPVATGGGLTSIALRGARGLTDAGAAPLIRARGVHALDFAHCPRITDATLRAPWGPNLASLDARGCRGVRTIALLDARSAPALTSLTLAACPAITTVALALPSLATLSVSGCRALETLDLACPALTSLAAGGCPALTTLWPPAACPALADVNLFGARALPSAALEPALMGAGGVSRLIVNGATTLSRLRVPSPSLITLDASGCGALAEVATVGTQLTELRLAGCSDLARLDVAGGRLTVLKLDGTARLPADVRAAVERLVVV